MNKKLNILHLEDNDNDSELLLHELEKEGIEFDYIRVENEKDFINALYNENYDIIFSDFSLPSYDGLKALEKAVFVNPEIPFILVSGTLGEDAAVESMKKGATDYVLKNKIYKLVPTINRAIIEVKEKKRRKAAENRYGKLIESARDVIFAISSERKIISLNKAFEKITGLNREEWIGKDFSGIIHPNDLKIALTKFKNTIEGKISESYEIRFINSIGDYLFGEVLTTLIDHSDGEIEILGVVRDITERKKHQQIIVNSLKEKEIMLKEIHHRVNNNLQIISSLINMQTSGVKDIKSGEILKETKNRVMSMSYIHQCFYGSPDLSEIDFETYLKKLTDNLMNVYRDPSKKIIIKIDAKNIKLGIDIAIPCGLIINEVITNSIKHAFDHIDIGVIEIKMKYQEDKYVLELIDNGCGISDGIDFRRSASMGLSLIRMLISQLDGDYSLVTKQGTCYNIKFPNKIYLNRLKGVKVS